MTETKLHYRGGKVYRRPVGCVRFAVRVANKYPDSTEKWLGVKGTTDADQTGWPVAYHGTLEDNVLSILRNGFDLEKCKRFAYGEATCLDLHHLAIFSYSFQGREFTVRPRHRRLLPTDRYTSGM